VAKKRGEGLKAAAEREAGEAEAEAAGKEEKAPRIWDRSPSQEDIVRADAALRELQERAQDMGPEAVIDALLQVVDVHPEMKVPSQWPGESTETLIEAEFIASVGKLLLRGCPKLEASPTKVRWLWRNKKTWTVNGVAVRSEPRKLGELTRFYARGAVAAVVCNYQLFRLLNTRQKIQAIYNALRQLDAEGTIRPPQFSGFFDELQLFGTGTNETDVHLVRAIEKGQGRQLPFEFPPLSVGDPDAPADEQEQERRVS
jgi:hypothetical protein